MKLHLPLRLLSALLAVVCVSALSTTTTSASGTYTPKADLGNVMYVGDSITHGVGSASYRWAMHKILVDNAISYDEVGVSSGNYSGGLSTNTVYGGRAFENVHSSISSERAYEIAGRTNSSGRLGNSNIYDWLGLDTSYAGTYTIDTATEMPDTFFLLIGTNDLLSDGSNSTLASRIDTVTTTLLGDMGTIHTAMQTANSSADIVVLSIPCWTTHSNGNSAETHQAVATYNESLREWAAGKEGVTLVDVNKGILDVASSTPFFGVSTMFRNAGSDGLHPNAQGDLLMAGNIARQLGYAGRTAGQVRKAASSFETQGAAIHSAAETTGTVTFSGSDLTLNTASSMSYSWNSGVELSNGYTVDFTLSSGLGNGSSDGWNTTGNLAVTIGNGTNGGVLNINEAYIQWGDTVLYSADMSEMTDSLRVAYVYGDPTQSLDTGYYVWLDDMLIGEALSATSTSVQGLTISNGSGVAVTLSNLALDSTASWAPTSNGASYGNPTIEAYIPASSSGEGTIRWLTDTASYTTYLDPTIMGSSVRSQWDSTTGAAGKVVGGIIRSGNGGSGMKINAGTYTGDLWLTVTGTATTTSSQWNAVNTSTLTGDAYLRFDENYTATNAWGTIFASANGTVNGDVYMEFSSDAYVSNGGTFNGVTASVAGAYKSNISGKVTMVFNAGTFNKAIYGGEINQASNTIGSTAVYLNKGTFAANIYAGGTNGTISGDTALFITGNGVITSGVTEISAGGTGGTIAGNSTLTLRNLTEDSSGFVTYSGTLSGGSNVTGTKTLVIDNVNIDVLRATLTNFHVVQVTGESSLALSSLGGATTLSVADSALTLSNANGAAGTSYELTSVSNVGGTITVGDGVSLAMNYAGDQQTSGAYVVEGGSLDFKGSATASSVEIKAGSLANAGGVTGKIKLNASGNVSLSDASVNNVQLTLNGGTVTGGTLNLAETAALYSGSVSNVMAGTAGVVKSGLGTATLSGANSYSGGTSVQAGTLVAGHAQALGSGAVTLAGGTLDLGGQSVGNAITVTGEATLAGASAYAGALQVTGGTLTVSSALKAQALTLTGGSAAIDGELSTNHISVSRGYTLSAEALTSSAFRKLGAGALTLDGTLHASGTLYMSAEGSLTLGGLDIAAGTTLVYLKGAETQLADSVLGEAAGAITLDLSSYVGTEGRIDLGLSSALSAGNITILNDDGSRLVAQDGRWYVENLSLLVEGWDTAWRTELAGVPAAITEYTTLAQDGLNMLPLGSTEGYLSVDPQTGTDSAIRITATQSSSTQTDRLVVVGGQLGAAGSSGSVEHDSWIMVEGGYPSVLVGGNYCREGTLDFTGNSHICVNIDTLSTPGSVKYAAGGNHMNGAGTPVFNGDSWISVMSDSVTGAVIGGSTVSSSGNGTSFNGDTHLFIYCPQTQLAVAGGPLGGNTLNHIIGGNASVLAAEANGGTMSLTGNTQTTLNFAGTAAGTMKKTIIGSSYAHGSWSSTHTGDSSITITQAGQATFAEAVIAGAWAGATDNSVTGATNSVSGTLNLSIDSGSFSGIVVGGSYDATGAATGTAVAFSTGRHEMALTGGTFDQSVVGGMYDATAGRVANSYSSGSIALTVAGATLNGPLYGGSYSQDNGSATRTQGDISLVLESGTINGNIYAAGYQGGSAAMTTASTSVTIGGASSVPVLGAITVSGGYEYANGASGSTVTGTRALVFARGGDYGQVRFADFDSVAMSQAVTAHMDIAAGQTLRKTGAGELTLAGDAAGGLELTAGNLVLAGHSLGALSLADGTVLDATSAGSSAGELTLGAATIKLGADGLGADSLTLTQGAKLTLDVGTEVLDTYTLFTGLSSAAISGIDLTAQQVLSDYLSNADAFAGYSLSVQGNALVLTNASSVVWQSSQETWDGSWAGGLVAHFDDSGLSDGAESVLIAGAVEPLSVDVSNSSGTYTFSAADGAAEGISGEASLTKSGEGTLTMELTNSYSGATSLLGGTLNANAEGALGTGSLSVAGGTLEANAALSNSSISISGGSVKANVDNALGSGAISLKGGTLVQKATLGNTIAFGGGTLSYDMASAASVKGSQLALAPSFSGPVKVQLDGAGSDITWDFSGSNSEAVLAADLAVSGAGSLRLNGASVAGAGHELSLGSGTTVILSDAGEVGYALTASDGSAPSGTLEVNGAATLTGNSSAFDGTLRLNGAQVVLADGNAAGGAATTLELRGSTVTLAGENATLAAGEVMLSGENQVGGKGATLSGRLTGSGSLLAAEELKLAGELGSFAGTLGSATASSSFCYTGATATSLNARVVGDTQLTQSGAGELSLTQQNSSTGTLSISSGSAATLAAGAAWAGSIANEGTLNLADGARIAGMNGGTLAVAEGATAHSTGDISATTLTNKGTLEMGSQNLTLSEGTAVGGNVNAGSLVLGAASSFGTVNTAALTLAGEGCTSFETLNLSGTLTLVSLHEQVLTAGTLSVANQGALNIQVDESLIHSLSMGMHDTMTLATLDSVVGAAPQLTFNGVHSYDAGSYACTLRLKSSEGKTHLVLVVHEGGTEWVSPEASWDASTSWGTGMSAPDASTAVNFFGHGSAAVNLGADTEVKSILVNTHDYPVQAYSFSGDATLTTSLLSIARGSLSIGAADDATTKVSVTGATTVGGEGAALSVVDELRTASLSVLAGGSFSNEGSTTVTGALVADAVSNSGSLSFGSGSAIGTLRGGAVTITGDASVSTLQEAASLTVAGGAATIGTLAMAGTAPAVTVAAGSTLHLQQSGTTLAGLNNSGTLVLADAQGAAQDLTLSAVTTQGGTVMADTLTLSGVGNSFTGLCINALTLDASALSSALDTAAVNLGAGGLAVNSTAEGAAVSIALSGAELGFGTYALMSGLSAGADSLFALGSDFVADAQAAHVSAVLRLDGDTLNLVLTELPDTWNTGGEDQDGVKDVPTTGTDVYSSTVFSTIAQVVVSGSGDKATTIDLTESELSSAANPQTGLVLNNVSGEGELNLVGKGMGQDLVTLANDKDTSSTATLSAENVTLQVGTPEADGSVEKLSLGTIELTDAALRVNESSTLTVSGLIGNEDSKVMGALLLVEGTESSRYQGRYEDASITVLSGEHTLAAGQGVTLTAQQGSMVTLDCSSPTQEGAAAVVSIASTGADVVLNNAQKDGTVNTLKLNQASTMEGGSLRFAVDVHEVAEGSGTAITDGAALQLRGVKVIVTEAESQAGMPEIKLEGGTSDRVIASFEGGAEDGLSTAANSGNSVTLEGQFLTRNFINARMEDNQVLADLNTTYYSDRLAQTESGEAGLKMMDIAHFALTPQANRAQYKDLAGVLDALDHYAQKGHAAAADRLASAVAGASATTLGLAFSDDLERQLQSIRNRSTSLGDLQGLPGPVFNAWINAEGNYREVDADSTLAGYTLSSWGGSFGYDITCTDTVSVGLAATAMYGDLDADAADHAEGDLDTFYLSAFGRVTSGRWNHTFVASIGQMEATLERKVSHSAGSYTASGETDGMGLGLMYEISCNLHLTEDKRLTLQPVANVTWKHVEVDGYAENGSDAALSLSDQELDTLTFGLGARMQACLGERRFNQSMLLEARALAKIDAGDRESELNSVLLNSASTPGTIRSAEHDAFGVELGLGLTIPVDEDSGSFFADASVELRGDTSNVNATIGYRLSF